MTDSDKERGASDTAVDTRPESAQPTLTCMACDQKQFTGELNNAPVRIRVGKVALTLCYVCRRALEWEIIKTL